MAIKKRRRAVTSPIDKANEKSDADFIKAYLEPEVPGLDPWRTEWTHPATGQKYSLGLARPAELGEEDLEACYRLIKATSRADYEDSAMKWRPAHKRQEMRSPELRYIVVREKPPTEASSTETSAKPPVEIPARGGADVNNTKANGTQEERGSGNDDGTYADDAKSTSSSSSSSSSSPTIPAFTSLMPVYEEGEPVVYCYEIHLSPALQGSGLGRLLLGFQSIVAHNLGPPVSKVMLTCFLSNQRALQFYNRQGFATDPLAPTTRRLRGGKTFVPDYTILSKPVVR
ncbi:N alpha-acetyl-transferase [Sporothrix curviconia]|uniref:N-alpha-acetyltransferase 40 n=1 Tax=Sporothrix curviconia TaxID=1260050 RepID=A0ABP0BP50_9PEZI